jgi:hypothetical protein
VPSFWKLGRSANDNNRLKRGEGLCSAAAGQGRIPCKISPPESPWHASTGGIAGHTWSGLFGPTCPAHSIVDEIGAPAQEVQVGSWSSGGLLHATQWRAELAAAAPTLMQDTLSSRVRLRWAAMQHVPDGRASAQTAAAIG